jgi:hypothetical protein
MPLLLVPVLVVLAVIALVPLSIVQRYRMGTSRQRARGWLATLNVAGLLLSCALFLASAALTAVWVPGALTYAATGLLLGGLLGLIGLWLTRWEPTAGALHFTPNRWLVLGLMLVITARICYGLWRAWHTWRAGLEGAPWFVASGLAGSIAAGAVVLGYYLTYWVGVRRRYRRHAARSLRRM